VICSPTIREEVPDAVPETARCEDRSRSGHHHQARRGGSQDRRGHPGRRARRAARHQGLPADRGQDPRGRARQPDARHRDRGRVGPDHPPPRRRGQGGRGRPHHHEKRDPRGPGQAADGVRRQARGGRQGQRYDGGGAPRRRQGQRAGREAGRGDPQDPGQARERARELHRRRDRNPDRVHEPRASARLLRQAAQGAGAGQRALHQEPLPRLRDVSRRGQHEDPPDRPRARARGHPSRRQRQQRFVLRRPHHGGVRTGQGPGQGREAEGGQDHLAARGVGQPDPRVQGAGRRGARRALPQGARRPPHGRPPGRDGGSRLGDQRALDDRRAARQLRVAHGRPGLHVRTRGEAGP